MALEINRVFSAARSGTCPRISRNLITSDLDAWSPTITGNGQTPTYAGNDNGAATFAITPAGTMSRSMVGRSFTFESGKTYLLFGHLTVNSGAVVRETICLSSVTSLTDVVPSQNLVANATGWWGIRFTATAAGSTICRVGLAPNNANETSAANITWDSVGVYEYTSGDNVPFFAHGFFDDGDSLTSVGSAAYPLTSQDTFNSSTGLITTTLGAKTFYSTQQRFTVGLFVGDSYSNDTTDWPAQLVALDGHLIMIGRAETGQTLAQFDTAFADVLTMDLFPHVGIKPEFVVVQGSYNSVADAGQTAATMLASTESMIDKANAAGILAICTTVVPVGNINTQAEYDKLYGYNFGLSALCAAKSAIYVDVSKYVEDPANPGNPYSSFDVGDSVHLTAAGYIAYARPIAVALRNLRSGAGGGRALIGNLIG